jgi:2-amino-4-hydroxy-6-hydroxymethyldihydropteridine diphosphokinase
VKIAIGLGSNLDDRLAVLRDAVRRIELSAPVLARSRIWETAPVGGPSQGDFLNAAILVAWAGPPIELLDVLLAIELELGRVRIVPNGPRTIDLDVLWGDGLVSTDPHLIVPHPRLRGRAFALAPMLDVVPGAVDPTTGEIYRVPEERGIRLTNDRL